MNRTGNGGQAFPVVDRGVHTSEGMSLRDYFAAQVATALCSHEQNILAVAMDKDGSRGSRQLIAQDAYGMADALIAEGQK